MSSLKASYEGLFQNAYYPLRRQALPADGVDDQRYDNRALAFATRTVPLPRTAAITAQTSSIETSDANRSWIKLSSKVSV
jgi:hypothetical protein